MTENSVADLQPGSVGFVGLGQQGTPMAANLVAAGHDLIVRDTDLERERRFVAAHGSRGCDGNPAALAETDVLITMLPNGQVVRDALLGQDAIASRLRPGTIIVDTSSSDPYGTRELGSRLADLGLVLLDSPVTRPEAVGDDTRRITFMVAGDDDAAIDRVMPLLEAMGEQVFRAGRLGSGHAMKTLNNYVSAAGLAAALDAMVAGRRFGIDVETMLEVFNAGTARNFSTANTLIDEAMSRRYGTGFQLALMVKDLRIASSLFERVDFDAPISPLVRDQFADALAELDDQSADLSRSLEGWESRAGVTVPPPRRPAQSVSFGVGADHYDRFMGRYSGPLAPRFADFAGIRAGQRALDVGCGPGSLTGELVLRLGADAVCAVDPSESFVAAIADRYPDVRIERAAAEQLPFEARRFDAALAQLVVHFMADPVRGLGEMLRVTKAGGVVAACVWDHAGGQGPLGVFWEAARELDADVEDESALAGAREGHLGELLRAAGASEVRETALSVDVAHATFEDWWDPFLLGVGPAGSYVSKLDATQQARLRDACRDRLPRAPFVVSARAWAARGVAGDVAGGVDRGVARGD